MCMQIADDSNAIELALETASYESHEFISLRRKGLSLPGGHLCSHLSTDGKLINQVSQLEMSHRMARKNCQSINFQ